MNMFYILENDEVCAWDDWDDWDTDEKLDAPIVGMFGESANEEPTNIPLTQKELERLNELAQDDVTHYTFLCIYREIDGSPIEALHKALKIKFKLYLDEDGEKDKLMNQWWEERFGKIPKGAEKYIDLEEFFYNQLKNRKNFYALDDFIVEIVKEG